MIHFLNLVIGSHEPLRVYTYYDLVITEVFLQFLYMHIVGIQLLLYEMGNGIFRSLSTFVVLCFRRYLTAFYMHNNQGWFNLNHDHRKFEKSFWGYIDSWFAFLPSVLFWHYVIEKMCLFWSFRKWCPIFMFVDIILLTSICLELNSLLHYEMYIILEINWSKKDHV